MTPADEAVIAALEALRLEMRAGFASLRAERAALANGRGPRDDADRALLLAVAEAVGGRWRTAADLIDHAAIAPALKAAFEAADVVTAGDLGTVFARLRGITISSLRLERGDKTSRGLLWRVVVVAE